MNGGAPFLHQNKNRMLKVLMHASIKTISMSNICLFARIIEIKFSMM